MGFFCVCQEKAQEDSESMLLSIQYFKNPTLWQMYYDVIFMIDSTLYFAIKYTLLEWE